MNSSEKMRKMNARFVKVVAFKKGYNRLGQATAIAKTYTPLEFNSAKTVVRSRDLNRYVSSIVFLDKKLNVKVSCSCPDFLFRWEYPLYANGAADIVYGNGDPANTTNPGNVPGMCKHLIALRVLIKNSENV